MRQRRVLQSPAWLNGCGQSMRLVATLELCSMTSAKQPPALSYPHLRTTPSFKHYKEFQNSKLLQIN
jgi:hypothetical protein